MFKPAVVATGGLGHVRFHDLRHTFASICSDRGILVGRVSAWMGHSTTSITLDTYTHLSRGDEDVLAVESLTEPLKAETTNVVPMISA
jgi:integrase